VDEIPRLDEEVDEIERARLRLEPFVTLDAALQFLLEQRREIGVSRRSKLVERHLECLQRRDDRRAQHTSPVIRSTPVLGVLESPIARKINQTRFNLIQN
jgi:hypothetical protein